MKIPKEASYKLAPKKNSCYTRSNPDPHPPVVFENPNLISRSPNKQKQKDCTTPSLENVQPSCIPTPVKVLFRSNPTSPSSSSTPPSTGSTPSSTSHTATTTPTILVIRVVPFVPATMANRYAHLQLPANPRAMP